MVIKPVCPHWCYWLLQKNGELKTYFAIDNRQKRMLKTEIYLIAVIKYVCTSKKVTQKCNILTQIDFKQKDSIKHKIYV
jgi:hypothetical protein